MVLMATLVLAYCSIVYELLLGQTLSAFLGNTVLRYSVTIGLYMCSMGVGAALVRGRIAKRPLHSLQIVEIGLSVIGGFCVALLFLVDYAGFSKFLFSGVAHSLIIIIGILSGLEIPLLIALRETTKGDSTASVLGFDYVGAFAGTISFAFLFYPSLGLVHTAFIIAFANSLIGLFVPLFSLSLGAVDRASFILCIIQLFISLILGFSLWKVEEITSFLLDLYLSV